MTLPIRSPRAADVPVSHRDRLSQIERRVRSESQRKPKKPLQVIDFGVSGPVVVGATSDWPCPDNILTADVLVRLRAYTSGTVTALLKKVSTTVLTINLTAAGTFAYPLAVRGTKDADYFWLDVTSAGVAQFLNVQLRYR